MFYWCFYTSIAFYVALKLSSTSEVPNLQDDFCYLDALIRDRLFLYGVTGLPHLCSVVMHAAPVSAVQQAAIVASICSLVSDEQDVCARSEACKAILLISSLDISISAALRLLSPCCPMVLDEQFIFLFTVRNVAPLMIGHPIYSCYARALQAQHATVGYGLQVF